MGTDTDNPILEPAAVFYGTPETAEPKEPTNAEVAEAAQAEPLESELEEVETEVSTEVETPESEPERDELASDEVPTDDDGGLQVVLIDNEEITVNEIREMKNSRCEHFQILNLHTRSSYC